MTHEFTAAAHAFHSQGRDTATVQLGQDVLLKAAKLRIQTVQRHLYRVERESVGEHFQVDGRVFVSREPDETDLSLLPGEHQRFRRSVGLENKVGIAFVDDFVDLPDVNVIGTQARQ